MALTRRRTDEQRQLLGVNAMETIRYRRVRLICGGHVLSEADNWYVPARLTLEMNRVLDTTDTAFGRAMQSLNFRRRTLSAKLLWSPLPQDWEMGAPLAERRGGDTHHTPRGAGASRCTDATGRHAVQRGGRDLYRRGASLPGAAVALALHVGLGSL